ncbi:restriction endonuclease fold toxin [Rhizobium laguerreae]|uniref:restriction endonuclease fold toxin n=1 Tax=Rhizobium laguerreae TaxID=1076926 RepID=UPI001389A7FD|nr:restriction endonuclease fold toxin [Rhizobium laguerreae]NDK52811.1 hypothetical protein [Rhizobium laguerreae]
MIQTLKANNNGGGDSFPELQGKMAGLLKDLGGKYEPPPKPVSPNEAEFWKAMGDATDGLQKIFAVNRSLLRASASGGAVGHLSQLVNVNGFAKGTALQEVLAEVPTNVGSIRGCSLVANTNFLAFTDVLLSDLKAAGGVPDQPYDTALSNNRINIASNLIMVAATSALPITLLQIEASTSISGPIESFLKGMVGGIVSSAVETVNALAGIIKHPVESARAIAHALKDVPALVAALKKGLADSWDTIREGSAEDRGKLLGRLSFEIAVALAGGAVANRIAASAELGTAALRRLTDQFILMEYAAKARSVLPSIPLPLQSISAYLADGIDILWQYQNDTNSVLNYIRATELEFDTMLKVEFLEGASLSPAGRQFAEYWDEIILDENVLVTETGTAIGLSNAKSLIGKTWAMQLEGDIPHSAAYFADTRYSAAFENSLQNRLVGTKGLIDGFEVDVITNDRFIQASVNEFNRTPDAIEKFMINKRTQIETTSKLAAKYDVQSVYYFRRQPPEEVISYLKSLGIDDVLWDLK